MRKNPLFICLAALFALLMTGMAAAEETLPTPPRAPALTQSTPAPAGSEPLYAAEPAHLRLIADAGHPALMECDGKGAFYPDKTVSHSALCSMLAPMLTDLPEAPENAFTDLRVKNTGYADAAALYAAGLVPAEDGAFRPRDDVTRQELSLLLVRLGEALSGPAGERARALAEEVAAGETALSGASDPITRAELAVILVRLAGREPDAADEAALFLAECLPTDIALDDYAWSAIADAVTASRPERPEAGVHRAYGWLYATWEDGTLIRDMDVGVWTFGLDGRYTTGDAELDTYLYNALAMSGASGLTGRDALAAAYLYVKNYGEYLVRPEDMDVLEPGALGWEYDYALRFFRYGGGTCYGFAAAFGLMARALGETAYIVSAQVNQYYGAHSFVVIPEDGVDYIYDVELEATRQERHPDLALFHITNFSVYSYWYTPDWA